MKYSNDQMSVSVLEFMQGHRTASQWQYYQGSSLSSAVRKTWQLEPARSKLCKMQRDKHPEKYIALYWKCTSYYYPKPDV